jgi:Protein of unknown function (DUF3224)
MQARATFSLDSWNEEPYDSAEGAKLLRARVTKTFRGDIEGTSTAELLMVHTSAGPAAYTAHEWFTGTVQGRQGSFVSQHGAVSEVEGVAWTVVAGSGTGDLVGIQGTGSLNIDADGTHHFTLDYELG